jgi:hypothetical protein
MFAFTQWSASSIALAVFVPTCIVLLIARFKKGLWPFDAASQADRDEDVFFYSDFISDQDRERREGL